MLDTHSCCSRRDDPHAHCTHCIAIMRRHAPPLPPSPGSCRCERPARPDQRGGPRGVAAVSSGAALGSPWTSAYSRSPCVCAQENLDLVCASLNQKEAALKESGASSETARQEEEIRELKSFQAKLEQDKREAEDKAAEAKKAAAAAKTAAENQSSVEKTTLEGMASEMQLLEDGVSFADKELRRGDNPERLERTGKFVDRKVRQPRICQNRRTSL